MLRILRNVSPVLRRRWTRGLAPIVAAFAWVGLLPPAGFAQDTSTPQAALSALYASYAGDEAPDERKFFSTHLNELYAADAAKAEAGENGNLDFDPVVGGQDYEIKELDVGRPTINGDIAIVGVRFRNFGTPTELRYTMRLEGGGWKIEDIESVDPANPWTLSRILAGAAN